MVAFFEFEPFGPERLIFVAKTKSGGEKELRRRYPHMKATSDNSYLLDRFNNSGVLLCSCREVEVVE